MLALVLVALTAVALVLELRTRTRGRLSARPRRRARRRPVRLGAWPASASRGALVSGSSSCCPRGCSGTGSARDRGGRALRCPWHAALHSLGASALAAAVTLVAALPVALLALRYPSRLSRALERLTYAGNALPGIVVALSLVFFAARYASPVYQSLALLVFAYVVRFFP